MQDTQHGRIFCAPSLYEVFLLYIEKRDLKDSTIDLYDYVLKWGLEDWLPLPIDMITREMIEDRHRLLSRKNGKRGSGQACADLTMRTLRTLMNFAGQRCSRPDGTKVITDNPVRWLSEIKGWNKAVRRQGVLKSGMVKPWFKAVMELPDPILRDYLLVLLFMGLRRTEGARLQWSDVDFSSGFLTARDTKNGDDHTLPMPSFIAQILGNRYWYMRPDPNDFVFPGRFGGKPLSENYKGYQKLWETLGFRFMLHDLRRSFLTIGESQDIPLTTLKWLANHRSKSDVTMGYLIVDPERLREPIEMIAKRILELAGQAAP